MLQDIYIDVTIRGWGRPGDSYQASIPEEPTQRYGYKGQYSDMTPRLHRHIPLDKLSEDEEYEPKVCPPPSFEL